MVCDCHADVIWYADFRSVSILTMTAVLIIVFIESMGMFLALGEIVGRKLSSRTLFVGYA